ncbi:CDP-alcohol phosphatidyltransferase family protein [Olsenella sp. An290]|uniref:CDP-alcohol phosphatidyltransferase family protein n=1 Tax=Olsenella sp. An290 TaxID=1965625 RepID=UPI001EF454BD|nr:CDP-alcohol phosphatidyltransferase family protein [Olsenella sp. An290]
MSERADRIKTKIKTVTDADAAQGQLEGSVVAPVGTSENPSSQVLTVANVITFCRLALTVAFLVLFTGGGNRAVALGCYAVAAVTDFLDGQVARRTQTVSWLGKIMDPIMDRVLLFTGVLGLLVMGELPAWVPAFVIGRDVYLAAGALYLRRFRERPVDVAYVGKAATALLMFGFCDLLLGLPRIDGLGLVDVAWLPGLNAQPSALGILFVYAGVLCSVATAVVYTKTGLTIRREALAGREAAR